MTDHIGDPLTCSCCDDHLLCPKCEGGPLITSAVSMADDCEVHGCGYICKSCGSAYNAPRGPAQLEHVMTFSFEDLQKRLGAIAAYQGN